jgi:hypothetical protein
MLLSGATGADILRHPVGDETPIAVRYWQIRRPVENFLRRLPPARPTPTPAKRRNRQPNFAIYASSLITHEYRAVDETQNRRVSNGPAAVQRSRAGRLGTGRSYRDGRGRFYTIGGRCPRRRGAPISGAQGTFAGDRHRLGRERLPHLVLGRLRLPGQPWSLCLRGR